VFSDFYVAALCNLCFTTCGSYMEQVWPPLLYSIRAVTVGTDNEEQSVASFSAHPNWLF